MRLAIIIKAYVLAGIFTGMQNSFAQSFESDTFSKTSSLQSTINIYHQLLSPEAGLYNGSEYAYNVHYPFVINEGDPYFHSEFDTGSVFYNNVPYHNVPLLYDIIMSELIIRDPTNIYNIKLNNERVSWFKIYGHTFYKLRPDNATNVPTPPGFYELLYNGKTSLYKKTSKKIKENSANAQGINKYVVSINEYLIKQGERYYPVKNKKELLVIMNDKKKAAEQFINQQNLNFRKDIQIALEKMVAFYDEGNVVKK